MVSKTTAKNAADSLLEGVDIEGIETGKAFARQERKQIVTVVELEVVPADEDWMQRRNYDFRSPQWQALFPAGFPVIKVGLKGVDVRFAFSADEINRIYIPIRNQYPHQNAGKTKGRGSQMHVFIDALKQVYGPKANPLTEEGRQVVLNAGPALWGQHLGEMEDPEGGSQKREWGWDIPRELMPTGFTYTGEVRVIEGRQGENAAAAAAVGTAQLSEEESDQAVAEALVGLAGDDFKAHNDAVLAIKGLSGGWYDEATGGNVAQTAHEKGLIVPLEDGTIGLPEAVEA